MQKLCKLLAYIKDNVAFYSDIDISNFEEIPIVNKQIIKSNYELFLSKKVCKREKVLQSLEEDVLIENYIIEKSVGDKYILEWTTGTSGVPFKCIKSIDERKMIALALWKRRIANDRTISVKNFYPLIHTGTQVGKYDIRNYDKDNIRKLYEEIERKNIVCIHATPNLLKRHIQKSGLPADFFKNKIPYIELTGHYLSEEDKKMFEDIFGARILNMYGLIEIWGIGYTCKCGKMHILEDNVYVEILNEKGERVDSDSISGEIIVTALNQYVMPFVRYRTGDYGYISEEICLCGNKDKVLVLHSERKANNLFIDGKYENGILFAKQIVRKIYWKHDFGEIMYICLMQKGNSSCFKFVLNDIKEKKMFELIAKSVFGNYITEGVLDFEYVSCKVYDKMNPKGYLFINKSSFDEIYE